MRIKNKLRCSCLGLPVSLWAILGAAFIMNILTLKDGHNWGDDFAHYLIYARNLLAGQPLMRGIVLDVDSRPPFGYAVFFGADFVLSRPGFSCA